MANVLAGAYVISAKTIVQSSAKGSVTCTLDAGGGSTDTAEFEFDPTVGYTTLGLMVTRDFPSTGSIVVRCESTDPAIASATKITAIKVDTVTREAVTG
jgi:hypothetical protein